MERRAHSSVAYVHSYYDSSNLMLIVGAVVK